LYSVSAVTVHCALEATSPFAAKTMTNGVTKATTSLAVTKIARHLRTQYVESIYVNFVTLKSRLRVTQGH